MTELFIKCPECEGSRSAVIEGMLTGCPTCNHKGYVPYTPPADLQAAVEKLRWERVGDLISIGPSACGFACETEEAAKYVIEEQGLALDSLAATAGAMLAARDTLLREYMESHNDQVFELAWMTGKRKPEHCYCLKCCKSRALLEGDDHE